MRILRKLVLGARVGLVGIDLEAIVRLEAPAIFRSGVTVDHHFLIFLRLYRFCIDM